MFWGTSRFCVVFAIGIVLVADFASEEPAAVFLGSSLDEGHDRCSLKDVRRALCIDELRNTGTYGDGRY